MLLLLALNLTACRSSEPVLSGLLGQESAASGEKSYAKPEGVWIDLSLLNGAPLDQVRGVLSMQRGDVTDTVELPSGKGRKLILEQGQVWEIDGRIYQVRVELPRPTRREPALTSLNIPTQIDRPATFSGEVRVQWHGGFERVRLGRSERWSELFSWVEVRAFDPKKG